MRMRIAVALAAALATAAVSAALAGSSKAAGDTTINIANCTLGHGGQITVDAGSTISFKLSWVTRTVGQEDLFLNALDLNAFVDGSPISDPMSYWSSPAPVQTVFAGGTGYIITWLYPTGITLQSGDSVTMTWNGVITHAITDGFPPSDGGGRVAPGDLLGGADTCTVAAT